jgi:class 3 adenylate cyclase
MGVQSTVVFADLFGSTGVFEALGNAKATEAVTQITAWLANEFRARGGRVVKFLGDGVLILFMENQAALAAVTDVQRAYEQRLARAVSAVHMPLRIGVARGDVEMVDDDCYGDAVNIAARLSELTGPHQIWVNAETIDGVAWSPGIRPRLLGPIHVRGRAEPCTVYQIEWQEDVDSAFFTIQSPLADGFVESQRDVLGSQIELTWLDHRKTFKAFELPVHIGRIRQAEFVVSDLHVSRRHARLDWRNGSVVLVDVSSYGCWVRFFGGGADLLLRREECVLHGRGEISLGTPFGDLSAPVVTFLVR